MALYETTWKDFQLPTGQSFSMAVCGYSKLIRHMTIGQDLIRRMLVQDFEVDGERCSTGEHCLALECPFNHTGPEHLAHMLDMEQDEPVDEATAKLWGKDTAVGCLVEMSRHFSASLAAEEATPSEKK